jgi:hypothetical protein
MSSFQRSPLISIAALATYLVVQVFAGVLHHHGAENRGRTSPQSSSDPQFRAADQREGGEEENCLLCSVLHLAQILPTALQVEAVAPLYGDGLSAAALIRPHPLETASHTRGPPLI